MTQKKQPTTELAGGGRGATPLGVLPAGREGRMPTAKRRSEETLAQMGKETALDTVARLAADGRSREAERLRAWVNRDADELKRLLAALPPTRGGHGRELRVSMCGVAMIARRGEQTNFARRACKDRLCPDCSARRSRRLAAALREQVSRRDWAPETCTEDAGQEATDLGAEACRLLQSPDAPGDCKAPPAARAARSKGRGRVACEPEAATRTRVLFVTLTQRKRPMEEPREALDRLLEAFKRFRQSRFYSAHIVGGIRAIEVTARGAGDRVGGHVVRVPGIHAHLHCLLEVRAGIRNRDVAAAWTSVADAEEAGVDVQEVSDDNIFQVSDYPVNMSGLLQVLTAAPDYVRKVVGALHGRRLVEALGAWRHWDLGLREPPGSLVYGDRSVYTLATSADAPDVRWGDGRTEPAEDVLRALMVAGPAPLNGAQPG